MFDLDLSDLDAKATLAAAARLHDERCRVDVEMIECALHFADLHPDPAVVPGHVQAPPGGERGMVYGGQGCPGVAEFAPAEFGAAVGRSKVSAALFIGQALALRHRLPLTWAQVRSGHGEAWKALQIAKASMGLSEEGAAIVDERVANIFDGLTPLRVANIVKAALWQVDPVGARAAAEEKARERGVWAGRTDEHGTTMLFVKAATGDVIRFDATVRQVADALAALGDADSLNNRRAKAIGILADPAYAHQLLQVAQHLTTTQPPVAPDAAPDPTNTSDVAPPSTREPEPAEEPELAEEPEWAPEAKFPPAPESPPAPTPAARPEPAAVLEPVPTPGAAPTPAVAPEPAPEHAPPPGLGSEPAASAHASPLEFRPASAASAHASPPGLGSAPAAPEHASSAGPALEYTSPPAPAPGPALEYASPPGPTPEYASPSGLGPASAAPEVGSGADVAARRELDVKLAAIKQGAYREGIGARGARGPARTVLYVHITDATLLADDGVARVEKYGPVLVTGLSELLGHDQVAIQPVIDLNEGASVDAYEIPHRIRERVKLTHPVELFPFGSAETGSRTDLDHIKPYRRNGPPGQTSTSNLQPLGRLSHRIKTHGGWTSTRVDDDTIEWITRHGLRLHVTRHGTHLIRLQDE